MRNLRGQPRAVVAHIVAMKRIVFLGGKDIGRACLEILHAQSERLGFQIAAVLPSTRGQSVREFCLAHAIPVLQSLESLHTIEPFEILLSVQYHAILAPAHIQCAREIALNLHLAPLPEYRGCNQFSFAILNGDTEFGVTIHRLERGIDSGAIAFERRFAIPPSCFVDELVALANTHAKELFSECLPHIVSGQFTLIPQSTCASQHREFHLRSEIESLKHVALCGGGGA